ncbi:Igfals [Symbiodinium sp. CCMP2592]|nr:Igfals [Symbiodinium sp. CCMP2592]
MPGTESRASSGFAAAVHLSCFNTVEVAVEGTATASAPEQQVMKLPGDPWHGNVLLSRGARKFTETDEMPPQTQAGNELALANYGRLHSAGSPLQIPTELSGITIPQIQALLAFMQGMVQCWFGTFGAECGLPLSFESFNLYHADYWILQPATAGAGGRGCSYVELVAESIEAQRPTWFVSHAWKEPIVLFLRCLLRHAAVRDLRGDPAYWVCAYANNQHALGDAIPTDPRKSSFYLAMMLCRGVLLVLDAAATPFQRIWCCFEEAIAVENSAKLFLDVAATSGDMAHILTDGLAGNEAKLLPLLGLLAKSRREEPFPANLLEHGLGVRIEIAEASREEDKTRILNSIAFPRAGTQALDEAPKEEHDKYGAVNRALRSHFALSSLYACYTRDTDPSNFLAALRVDAARLSVQLSLTGCKHFRDAQMRALLAHLPRTLLCLRLDLGHTGLQTIAVDGFCCQLRTLQLRFSGASLREAVGIAALLDTAQASLLRLELWFAALPMLEELNLSEALLKLRLEELSLHVQGCPKVPQASKQALHNAARKLQSRDKDLQMWLCIEDAATWTQQLQALLPWDRIRKLQGFQSSGSEKGQSTRTESEINQDLPFPCSHGRCPRFHANGYCDQHFFCSLRRSAFKSFQEARCWSELALIFFVQAAADIESRGLLLLIMLSLYPVLVFGVANVSGFSVSSLSTLLLALLVASFAFASFRFDQMQRAAREFSLSSEAFYSKVLEDDGHLSHTSLVFGVDGEKYPSVDQVRQETVSDLKSSFLSARQHLPSFERAVQEVVRAVDAEGMEARLKCGDEALLASECQGAVDILQYEIYCKDILHMRQTWNELSRAFQGEEQPIRIVALRDGFAEEDSKRRCCEVVLCIEGYFATVLLLERSLDSAERKLAGLCRMAQNFGLLVEPRHSRGQESKQEAKAKRSPRPSLWLSIILGLVRATALLCSGYFALQYSLRYGPPELRESLPGLGALLKIQDAEDRSWFQAISLALPYAVLVLVFSHDLLRCRRRVSRRLKPSQIIFERHFGVHGNCYVVKVALIQIMTVLLQAFGKVPLLRGTVTFAMYQNISAASVLKRCFWIFYVLLTFNSLFPSILFVRPDSRWCRYGAAVMDVVMDLGYMLTYLLTVVTAMSELTLETAVRGNFGDAAELDLSNSISPTFAFPSDILQFLAVYISLAHTCCACRSVERARDLGSLGGLGESSVEPKQSKRPIIHRTVFPACDGRLVLRCLKALYSPILLLVLFLLLRSPDMYPGHDFSCFPCRCSVCCSSIGWRLESCRLAAVLRQAELALSGVHSIAQGAFDPLGCYVRRLSLSNHKLTSLPAKRFRHLSCLEALDLGRGRLERLEDEAFEGLAQLRLLSLSENKLADLPTQVLKPLLGLEQLLLGGKSDKQGNVIVSGNQLVSLPNFTQNPRLRVLDVSENNLKNLEDATFSHLHRLRVLDLGRNNLLNVSDHTFAGLTSLQKLDLGSNKLEQLPETVFQNLTSLQKLDLHSNKLAELPETVFQNLTSLETLYLGWNRLAELPQTVFQGLTSLETLDLHENQLAELPETVFQGLTSLEMLDLRGNQLAELPQTVFQGLTSLQMLERVFQGLTSLESLDLSDNKLAELPETVFQGLTSLEMLDLRGNQLAELPQTVFQGLTSLETLDLHENQLAELPETVFQGLTSLERLDLSDNKLAELPETVFQGLTSLETLDLHWNQLQELPETVFQALTSLETLELFYSKLAELPAAVFQGLTSLEMLGLRGNQLAELPETVFQGLTSLKRLDLGSNYKLAELPETVFQGLTSLETLDLSVNIKLAELPETVFQGLTSLETLELFYNKLAELPAAVFQGLTSLATLKLHDNKLAELPEKVFHGLTSLETLELNSNNLAELPEKVFQGLTSLQVLELYSNQLAELPQRVFQGLTSLKMLHLGGNRLAQPVRRCVEAALSCENCGAIILRRQLLSWMSAAALGILVAARLARAYSRWELVRFIVCREVLVQISRPQSPESPQFMFCTGMLQTTASEIRGGAVPGTESRAAGFAAAVRLSFSTTVDVAVEGTATASDVIAAVKAKLPGDPWHGNVLLSRGARKFTETDEMPPQTQSGNELALANYGRLHSAGSPLQIPTELSGITIPQIQALLAFMQGMVQCWSGTFGAECGLPLSFECFNLYHADYWILQPATAGAGGHGCSYVELVAESIEAQRPTWFVSHAWKEPIVLFLRCLLRHAAVRDLRGGPAYWVCAYANNQHALGDAIPRDPRKSSFYSAMMLCRGVLLVLDAAATPFQRIWCCFEEAIAVENSAKLFLDVAATSGDVAHILTDGLAGKEAKLLPLLGLLAKSRREKLFPANLLEHGLGVRIEIAEAFREEDKTRILNSIAFPRAGTQALDEAPQEEHDKYGAVNRALRSHFALSSLYSCYAQDADPTNFLAALRADVARLSVQLSLTGCKYFRDAQMRALLAHLPRTLLCLRLDLGHTGLQTIAVDGFCCQLRTLQLRFSGASLREAGGIAALLDTAQASLFHLELWFAALPMLEELNLSEALLKLRLEELSLHVQGCPKVPQASKQALHNAARKLQSRDKDLQMWLCIEDAATWTQQLEALLPKRSKPLHRLCFRGTASEKGQITRAESEINQDLPFPCSHGCCPRFHANLNGYCDEHFFCSLRRSVFKSFQEARCWSELALIFFVQAAADIESRGLLLLILLSLYPVLVLGVANMSGFSVSSLSTLLLALLIASFSFASFRFDQMQRAAREFSLSSEAFYSKVLEDDGHLSHTSLVFGIDGDKYPSVDQVRQETVSDLKPSFLSARQHLPNFESAVQKVVRAVDAEGMEARLKCGDEALRASECQGAVDILQYEIYCKDILHMRQTWNELSRAFQGEEQPIRIVALRDGFAEEDSKRRCCEVVLCIEGYFATVLLLERSLDSAERKLAGLYRMAQNFGLLVEPRHSRGQESKQEAKAKRSPRPSLWLSIILGLVRATALLCSGYFALQYFLRYGPPELRESLPGLRALLKIKDAEDRSWFQAISLALPYAVLVLVFSYDLLRCRRRVSRRLKPSQIIFERHFGVHGNCYVVKVALIQIMTVLLQAFGKVPLLGGTVTFAMYQNVPAASVLKRCFWIFYALLTLNSLYPSILFVRPDSRWCRYGAAVMDIGMDLGYMLTYLLTVVTAMSELTLETAVRGNFGDAEELDLSNSISPTFAFPSDILQFLAVYISLAHTCCACRSVERAKDLGESSAELVEPKQSKRPIIHRTVFPARHGRLVLRCLKALYSPMLLLVLFLLLRSPDVYPGHSGDFSCFPCRCSQEARRLESCRLAAVLRQPELALPGVHSIAQGAFDPLGCYVRRLSLANNTLISLPAKRFRRLSCLEVLDLGRGHLEHLEDEAFEGLAQLRLLSLSENNITDLPTQVLKPLLGLEQLLLGGKTAKNGWGREIVRGNRLASLPDFTHNQWLEVLDVSKNELTALKDGTFAQLHRLRVLDINHNKICNVSAHAFAGLTSLQSLDLSSIRLAELPELVFQGLTSLKRLDLDGNDLAELPEKVFRGLTSLEMLDLCWNRLAELPENVFQGLTSLEFLDLRWNRLAELPENVFQGLTSLEFLDLGWNRLAELPENVFQGLTSLQWLVLYNNTLAEPVRRCVEATLTCENCSCQAS